MRQDLLIQKAPRDFSISSSTYVARRRLSQQESLNGPEMESLRHAIILHCLVQSLGSSPFFFMLLPSNSPAICFMNVMHTPSAPRTPLFTSSRTNHTN